MSKFTRWPLQAGLRPGFLERGAGCRVWDAETGEK